MAAFREYGVCGSYREYLDLPLGVLDDARAFVIAAERDKAAKAAAQGGPRGRSR